MALYLVHVTDGPFSEWTELKPSKWSENEFPGVYFSLVTEDNLNNLRLFLGKNVLIFSAKLLDQHNWHLNLEDHNGFITEYNTYYPWNLNDVITKKMPSNEVVFHDAISMKYLCKNLVKPENYKPGDTFLPNYHIVNKELPDLTKQPFYVFPFEDKYTGTEKSFKHSSKEWFKMLYKVADVTSMQELTKSSKYLYKHRDKQHLEYLEDYTLGHKSISKCITRTSF